MNRRVLSIEHQYNLRLSSNHMPGKNDYDRVMTRLLWRQRLVMAGLRLALLGLGVAMRAWEWIARKFLDIHPTSG